MKTVEHPQSVKETTSITGTSSEIMTGTSLIVNETVTVTAASAVSSETPSTDKEKEVISSPVYATESPVFPDSVISSPTKLHSAASSLEKTLQQVAEKLTDKIDVDTTVIDEQTAAPGNTAKDAVAIASATVSVPTSVILPVNVVHDSHESIINIITSPADETASTSSDAGKPLVESLAVSEKMLTGEKVSIDVVKDLVVTMSSSAKMPVFDAAHHAMSDSSDVSFHTVEDVAGVPSDLEISGTDEDVGVFESEKEDQKHAETTSQMTKLWSQAVAEGEPGTKADKEKDKQCFTKLSRQSSAGTGTSSKKTAPLRQRPVRPASATGASVSGPKPLLGASGGERKAKRTSADLSPIEKNDPLPNLRKAAKNSPGLEVIVQKLKKT